jgi:demethylmenaquinone methyltransferase/2-methoxy-6-polyprenyl-1,4-benzoquinol methylase
MDVLQEQIAYYRARAAEYDEWWLRQGRFDRGPAANAEWFAEVDQLHAALAEFAPRGHILELACGTGLWSRELAPYGETLTLVDSAPEVLAINAERVQHPHVQRIQADLFNWRPTMRYDTVFFSFWLSHVPPAGFERFWSLVGDCLAPGGRAFFIDSLDDGRATARDQTAPTRRRLNDGREFSIVKIYYEPADLQARLERLGWQARVASTPHYFLFGSAAPMPRTL